MRIVVLGAGVIGVSTAWALAKRGHEVVVLERNDMPARETSFANGGQISVSHSEPWANPSAPFKLLRWLGREDAPLLWRPRLDLAQWSWGLRFLIECMPRSTRANIGSLVSLGLYSRAALAEFRDELNIEYQQLQRGILNFYTDSREFARAQMQTELIRAHGCERTVKSAAECCAIEPALAESTVKIVGGTFTAGDESGDARIFSEALAVHCCERGVGFRFGASILGLERCGDRILAVSLAGGERIEADVFVMALGCYSTGMLRSLGICVPIYPVKGYSATVRLPPGVAAPCVSLTDEECKMVFSRLGETLRVAGTAEFNGYDLGLNPVRCAALLRRLRQVFPSLRQIDDVEYWTGLRPATPSNVPLVGKTSIQNLWVNSGHGTLGWTLACGSAKLLADQISGLEAEIDPAPYQLRRTA